MKQPKHQRIGRPAADLLPAVIESLLFVAAEPQEIATLAKSLQVPKREVEKAIDLLISSTEGRGVFVQRLGDSVQMATAPDAGPYIERFLEVDHGRLSRASLETLAIIAYRSPMTRATIESIRGVNSDHSVATLLARGLIEQVGRAPGPGRPALFATTHRFLEYFGLQRAEDLPPLAELEAYEEAAYDDAEIPSELRADGETDGEADPPSADAPSADARSGDEENGAVPVAVEGDESAEEGAGERD